MRVVPSEPTLLYVLRHAKSSWEDETLPDDERPLSARGERAVRRLAGHARTVKLDPELVLSSPARRTRETVAGLLPGHRALFEPALYGAGPADLLARLREVPPSTRSVMLVGHNPSVQRLVLMLAAPSRDDDRLAQIVRKFPTGALATLTLAGDWPELRSGGATLRDYVTPKSLG